MRVLTGAVILGSIVWFVVMARVYRLDLDVYRVGVQYWLDGGDLYAKLPETNAGISLPFIYPPIAAALMMPLALVPFSLASITLTVLTIALLAVTLTVVLDSLGLSRRWLLLFPVALNAEPVLSTLGFGQINVILMALVVLDCLVPKPKWPRGVLVGLAAAIKLTPAAFVLFFLLRRDYRAALNASLAFLAASALGFVVAGKESLAFWTFEVFHTTEKVGVDYVGNQSFLGVLTRLDAVHLWPLLAVFAVVLAITGMRRAEPTLALGVNALAVLLVSPISWSHHWVWCIPIVLAFAKNRMRLLAVIGAALFISGPHWWVGEESLAVNAYAAYAVIALAAVAVTMWHRGRMTAWTSAPSSRFLMPASMTGASSPPPSTRASVPATLRQVSSS